MKVLSTIAAVLVIITPALAEEIYFEGPGNSIIEMKVAECPDRMICMPSSSETASASQYDLNLMVPQWASEIDMSGGDIGAISTTYMRGMSDGFIWDRCDLCQCCVISLDPDRGFQDWSAVADDDFRASIIIAE